MTSHLFDHVRGFLEQSAENRIAYIQAPRWVGLRPCPPALSVAMAPICGGSA